MKALYKLVALALVAFAPTLASVAAPPPAADLTVLAGRGQRFLLSLDGRPLTGVATRQLHVSWLAPGRHLADVQVYSPYGPPVAFRTTIWLQPGTDSRFALASGPYGATLQPLGTAPGGGYVPGGGYAAPGASYGPPPAPYGTAPGGYGNGPGAYGGAPYGGGTYPAPNTYPPAAPGGGYDPNTYPNQSQPGYDNATPAPYLVPLSATALGNFAQQLRQQPTDALRLEVAQQSLAGNSLTVSELTYLLCRMGSELGRTQLVLLAYEHLADPDNLSAVYAQLQPTSVDEVQRTLGLGRTY